MVSDSMVYGPLVYTALSTSGATDDYDTSSENAALTSSITKQYLKQQYEYLFVKNHKNGTATCNKWHKYCDTSSTGDDWDMPALQWHRVGRNDTTYWCSYEWPDISRKKPPGSRLREIIQARQGPVIITTRVAMPIPQDVREMRARETLHRVLGDDKFRRFLKTGFVSVRAKSGLIYQIFPGHGITKVFRDGQQIERLCVVLRGNFPPTDSLIMRYLLILNDENKFRSYAVKHSVTKPSTPAEIDERSLVEIYKELKAGKSRKNLKLVA
jgi:hypothetical protein